jgi:periplasmic protein TonB
MASVEAPTGVDTGGDQGSGTGTGGGAGSGQGGGQGSGVGPGTGAAAGPGSAAPNGGTALPPEPRQLILPPSDYPKSLRGRTLDVTFWVDARGKVERVEVAPAVGDRGFAKKFEEAMRNYQFRPARSADGRPVPGSITVKVAFF